MHPFVTAIASAVGVTLFLWFLHNSARSIQGARTRKLLGAVMIMAGIVLMPFRAFILAIPLVVVGLGLILQRAPSQGQNTKTRSSQVRSTHLEMTLDHQTGKIDGRILTGRYKGRRLSGLTLDELLGCHTEVAEDGDTVRLLETFLDKTHPDWRAHAEEKVSESSDPLSRQEAYRVLGLEVGAGREEIREAYNRLIKRVHPDQGGAAALTAQITEARDKLLGAPK